MVRLLGPGHREELRCRGLCGKNVQSGLMGRGSGSQEAGDLGGEVQGLLMPRLRNVLGENSGTLS